jgi:hypothetical protein
MHLFSRRFRLLCAVFTIAGMFAPEVLAQGIGTSGEIFGTVTDSTGAALPGVTVEITNPVSAYTRTAITNPTGGYRFTNIPFNPYHLTVTAPGFAPYARDVRVRSDVPQTINVTLAVATASTSITVQASAEDLLENSPTFHTDLDRGLMDKMPLESQSSSVSSLVTLATPGVAADSNGLFHGMGDHAENSFSVDGQPITDQQSKVFSNQIPLDSVQSMEVIAGAPPAEYGDKTSVVINVTTRSGQGMTTPKGAVTTSYGSFGTSNVDFNLGYGGKNWGNFIAANGLNTGRFLDPPEFAVFHSKGNEENVFDRVDYQFDTDNTVHLNLGFTRSWFQNPNAYDNFHFGQTDPTGNALGLTGPLGPTDQRSQIKTFNISPSWTRLISSAAVFTLGAYVRHDGYNYYPSPNPFADIGPIQSATIGQNRTLTNAGLHSDLSYAKGIHNLKVGAVYEHWFLNENDNVGIVDPTLIASFGCLNAGGAPIPGSPCAALAPYDLTRSGGTLFPFRGHADVKQLGMYVQDAITMGNLSLNVGIRGDLYNGLTVARQAEPRVGTAYNIKRSNTVLRASYARTLETPFNENLIISSEGCNYPVLVAFVLGTTTCPVSAPVEPGYRNEFHAGLEQAAGKYFVFSGEYVWKYTHNGFDFSDLGNTPIFFPIAWHNSKITGPAGRVSIPTFHGLSALIVFSSISARFFNPQVGGLGIVPTASGVFRIDHDEAFNQTTHLQYQPWKRGPWLGFNWRYDSGLVAGAVPCYGTNPFNNCPQSTLLNGSPAIDLSGLTADEEFQAGMFCGSALPSPPTSANPAGIPLPSPCLASQFGSYLVRVPAPGTENPDHNPPRVASRHLFDLSIGHDNIFNGDRYKWSANLTVINVANEYALYNFLSTFSGTHYVTPRTVTGEIGFHF